MSDQQKEKYYIILNKAHLHMHSYSHVAHSNSSLSRSYCIYSMYNGGRFDWRSVLCCWVSIVFPTVVFLTFDLQILSIRLPTLWLGMVSHPPKSHMHTYTYTYTWLCCRSWVWGANSPEWGGQSKVQLSRAPWPLPCLLRAQDQRDTGGRGTGSRFCPAPSNATSMWRWIIITKDCF